MGSIRHLHAGSYFDDNRRGCNDACRSPWRVLYKWDVKACSSSCPWLIDRKVNMCLLYPIVQSLPCRVVHIKTPWKNSYKGNTPCNILQGRLARHVQIE